MQNRFKSKVVWMTILPMIVMIGDTYNLWNVINMPKDNFTQLYISIIAVLVAFGILNNPTNSENF